MKYSYSNSAIAYKNRGDLYESINEHEKALEDYNTSISKDSTIASTYNNRGFIHRRMLNYEQGNNKANHFNILNST